MAMESTAFSFPKANGNKVQLSTTYMDEATDKITSADGNMYDVNHDLHYVRPDQTTIFNFRQHTNLQKHINKL